MREDQLEKKRRLIREIESFLGQFNEPIVREATRFNLLRYEINGCSVSVSIDEKYKDPPKEYQDAVSFFSGRLNDYLNGIGFWAEAEKKTSEKINPLLDYAEVVSIHHQSKDDKVKRLCLSYLALCIQLQKANEYIDGLEKELAYGDAKRDIDESEPGNSRENTQNAR